ncbi:unnamed protein product [Medioppia subpectinata]|uniref:G-protein coupled receptors family 1 profile domain-containing protein n=1 Tax=Medioppia subpectinata TaxID=1979941 RepID=A0A7R9KLW0_9ACAR|nr:unnamed protein product [Medioppia subpectinata]CAG2106006.1 unnamed protein product [Medioppia subpectinata]
MSLLYVTCLTSSVLTLSAISCDRFVAIFFPLRARVTKQRTGLVIGIVWVVSLLVSIPFLIYRQHYTFEWRDYIETNCVESWPSVSVYSASAGGCVKTYVSKQIYYTFVTTTLFFLPVAVMITAYSLIVWRLWVNQMPGERNQTNVSVHKKAKKKSIDGSRLVRLSLASVRVAAVIGRNGSLILGPKPFRLVSAPNAGTDGLSSGEWCSHSLLWSAVILSLFGSSPVSSRRALRPHTHALLQWRCSHHTLLRQRPAVSSTANSGDQRVLPVVVIKMVCIVLAAFVISWMPLQVIVLYSLFGHSANDSGELPKWFSSVSYFATFIAYSNSVFNPIIYGGFNKNFRQALCSIFRCENKLNLIIHRKHKSPKKSSVFTATTWSPNTNRRNKNILNNTFKTDVIELNNMDSVVNC